MQYFTSFSRNDGFGAQLQTILIHILFTELHGNKYVFKDIQEMAHNYDNNETFLSTINTYLNLRELYHDPQDEEPVTMHDESSCSTHYKWFEENIDVILKSATFHKLQNTFYENKQNPFDNNWLHISVHIRRPNPHDNRIEGTNTSDNYYLAIIQYIRKTYNDKRVKFHIYSQGNADTFDKYMNYDTDFHLNESITDTFSGLLYGDILVTSASSFSYAAAILTKGIVYYKHFWHKPASHWVKGDQLLETIG